MSGDAPSVPAQRGAGVEPDGELLLRDQLSSLQGLLVLSMLMTDSGDEEQIVGLATTSVPSLARCELVGVHCTDTGWRAVGSAYDEPGLLGRVERALHQAGAGGGPLSIPGTAWAWAFPLRGLDGPIGQLLLAADEPPSSAEQFLLRVLAQQMGVAIVNARLHARERASAAQLAEANAALAETVRSLQRSTAIHEKLTHVAVTGQGQDGIARAVHQLTGLPVAVEDHYGTLRAWGGPERPDPYPKQAPAHRERVLARAVRAGKPIRDGSRLLAVARPRDDVLGVLALVDPEHTAREQEQTALEHGATVLAMELARLRSLADTELRLRRDLVEHLLSGGDEEVARTRAQALDYDLQRPHRVLVVAGSSGSGGEEALFQAVHRAARDTGAGVLLAERGRAVLLLSPAEPPFERLRAAIVAELDGGPCRIGVGSAAERPAGLPRSCEEARFALSLQGTVGGAEQVVCFEALGVYQLLSGVTDTASVERFARSWLGALLDYDRRKNAALVATLTEYLEHGGSYEGTAGRSGSTATR
jgi:hypothetical protein